MSHVDRLALAFRTEALSLPAEGAIVVLRAVPSDFLEMIPAERLRCEQTFRPLYDALAESGFPVANRVEGPAAMVVVNMTRSRAENLGNVARGLHLLSPGGRLIVAGAKTDGVHSLARHLGAEIPIEGAFVKAHGRVLWLLRPHTLPKGIESWAAEAAPAPNADGDVTAPGMFSPDHPDPGSRKLAAALEGRLSGRVADLGAGWGWLARAALRANPGVTYLDLHEAEMLALDAARTNVADPRAGFYWTDVSRLGRDARGYDAVVTNPPFHQHRASDPELGAAFILAAARILKPAGRLFLVANRQLPYEAVLAGAFQHSERLDEDGLYKVILAERPRRG